MLKFKKVHEDKRGEINIIYDTEKDDHRDIAILKTKKGFARGGCIHRHDDEICIVVEGTIKHHIIKDPNIDYGEIFVKGETIVVPKNHPHFFISITDSILIEWGATVEDKQEKDPVTRGIVERINIEASK